MKAYVLMGKHYDTCLTATVADVSLEQDSLQKPRYKPTCFINYRISQLIMFEDTFVLTILRYYNEFRDPY